MRAGDVARAESACRALLDEVPDHPGGLRLLARCHLDRREIEVALPLLLRAVKSPQLAASSRSAQQAIWTDLSNAFMQALSGLDVVIAGTRRGEYQSWRDSLASKQRSDEPLVSVVLICGNNAAATCETLQSVYQQSYRRIELIVVSAALEREEISALTNFIKPVHFSKDVRSAGRKRGGVDQCRRARRERSIRQRIAGGAPFAQTRIATLVEQIVNRDAQWGFTDVEFAAGRDPPSAESDPAARNAGAACSDGCCGHRRLLVIYQSCVAVAVGNLFFSRALFDRVGGFRELPFTSVWDFCLPRFVRGAIGCSKDPIPAQLGIVGRAAGSDARGVRSRRSCALYRVLWSGVQRESGS